MKFMFTLFFAALLAVCLPASADIVSVVQYTGYPAGINDGHFYVGLAGLHPANPHDPDILAWCIGSQYEVSDHNWPARVLTLDQAAADNPYGYDLTDFQVMALLGLRFDNTLSDIRTQYQIWSIGDSSYAAKLTASENADMAALRGSVSQFDYSANRVLIPQSAHLSQPFEYGLAKAAVSPVPEPGTFALLGTTLVGAAVFMKRKQQKK